MAARILANGCMALLAAAVVLALASAPDAAAVGEPNASIVTYTGAPAGRLTVRITPRDEFGRPGRSATVKVR